ncbi:MAG: outer membrane biogenesis protein BamB [Planctomycetes bacterium ADurb.Bin126]|nr:MAG: outer membrane biogenesis protein BamB [Planctomycetes bacterium ADurb.Bin126]HOD79807.1 PQQ-binding-like beta-propeller repeat protein [Phycisphaerae bacterium]HQL72815.1 PQQ-binding-like beta-propeller repeat protein [Phycisphaerae bacterium]
MTPVRFSGLGYFRFVLVCACLPALAAALRPARAADWPQWGGGNARNACSGEKNLPESFEPGDKDPKSGEIRADTTRNVKWSARLGGGCYGNTTVANGRVFAGTDDQTLREDERFGRPNTAGMVKCFDEKTGKLLWQLPIAPIKTPKEWHYGFQKLGVCSSPTVDGDRVYIVSHTNDVLCLDVRGQANGNDGPFTDEAKLMVKADQKPVELQPTDGDVIWRFSVNEELKVIPHDVASCSVVVHGDFVYLSTSNGVNHAHDKPLSPDAPAFIALNKHTGKLAAVEDEGISKRMFHTQWSSPCLATVGGRTLVVVGATDGFCYAFEPLDKMPDAPAKLKKVWQYDCNPPEYRLRDGKRINYLDGDKRKKTSPNKNDGTYLGPSEVIATPAFSNGRVYVAIGQDPLHGRGRGLLHCIDASKTGDITKTGCVWTYDGLDRTIANAVVAGGLVYIPDIAGRLHCVDADTGKPHWVHEMKAETWGSPMVADGKVYQGTQKALHVLAAGKEAKELARINLGSPIYSTPIAANGTLYFASQKYLWAVAKQPVASSR